MTNYVGLHFEIPRLFFKQCGDIKVLPIDGLGIMVLKPGLDINLVKVSFQVLQETITEIRIR